MNDAYDPRLKVWRLEGLQKMPGFSFERRDIRSLDALRPLFAENGGGRFEAVLNMAARAGVRPSVEDPWLYYETNVTGTLNLLELCRTFDIPKFILASTSS